MAYVQYFIAWSMYCNVIQCSIVVYIIVHCSVARHSTHYTILHRLYQPIFCFTTWQYHTTIETISHIWLAFLCCSILHSTLLYYRSYTLIYSILLCDVIVCSAERYCPLLPFLALSFLGYSIILYSTSLWYARRYVLYDSAPYSIVVSPTSRYHNIPYPSTPFNTIPYSESSKQCAVEDWPVVIFQLPCHLQASKSLCFTTLHCARLNRDVLGCTKLNPA